MKRLMMVAGLSMLGLSGACGKGAPPPSEPDVAVAAAPSVQGADATETATAKAEPADTVTPVAPVEPVADAPKTTRVSREDCEKATDHMLDLAVKQLAAMKSQEVDAVKVAMQGQRDDFLKRCLDADKPEVVACMLAASRMEDLMQCGADAEAKPLTMATEDECRRFVEKLDALALGGKMPEMSDEDKQKVAAQKDAIVKQCAREAPQEVIRCSLEAATIEEIDTCHDRYGALVGEKDGDHAGHDHAGHDHAGHGHEGHDHGAPAGKGPAAAPAGPLASDDACRRFTVKFTELNTKGMKPEEAGAMRKRMAEGLEAIVKNCTETMPKAVIDCGLAAQTLDDVMKCQP